MTRRGRPLGKDVGGSGECCETSQRLPLCGEYCGKKRGEDNGCCKIHGAYPSKGKDDTFPWRSKQLRWRGGQGHFQTNSDGATRFLKATHRLWKLVAAATWCRGQPLWKLVADIPCLVGIGGGDGYKLPIGNQQLVVGRGRRQHRLLLLWFSNSSMLEQE